MKGIQIPHVTDQLALQAKIKDLEALYLMTNYLREELLRVGSQGFWTTAFLPPLLQHEINELQEGRPLLSVTQKFDDDIPLPSH